MIIVWEGIILCAIFSLSVFMISKNPINTLYNYPPKIQQRVKSLAEYKDKIPTKKNKLAIKGCALLIFLIIISIILKYGNQCTTFYESFITGFILWTIVNLWDVIILDIIWFCHDKRFVIKGAEDMTKEYHNYWFHIKGFLIGEFLAIVICSLSGIIIQYVL